MEIRVSPVTAHWLGPLQAWREDPTQVSEYDDFGARPPGALARAFERTGLPDLRLVLVTESAEQGAELAGIVSWLVRTNGPNQQSRAWNIGVSIRPSYRGRGVGTRAHQLLVEHLFSTTDAHRLEAGTDVTNVPERAVLSRVGFRLEGVMRGAQYRRGDYRDVALYGLLRSDLAPRAHDGQGPGGRQTPGC